MQFASNVLHRNLGQGGGCELNPEATKQQANASNTDRCNFIMLTKVLRELDARENEQGEIAHTDDLEHDREQCKTDCWIRIVWIDELNKK